MNNIKKVEIERKTRNDLLGRTEGEAKIYFKDATPTRTEMRQTIAEAMSVNPEVVMITHTQNEFGKKDVLCAIHVYKSIDELKEKEPEYLQKRFGLIQDKKSKKAEESTDDKEKKK